jgi:cell division septation protein DedD
MADDRYHEFHLEGKQLAFLFMTATAVVVVSFLVGVMVGRGVERVGAEAPESALVDATADPALTEESFEADGGAGELAASSARQDDYSYFERLNRPAPAAERLRTPEPVREPEPVPPPPAVAAVPAPAAVVERSTPATAKPAPSPSPRPAASAVAKVSLPSIAGEPSGTGYSVQVLSVGSRAQADASAHSLASKGYPAYVQPIAGGLFRVRVGTYPDREDAVAVARRLETEEKFNKTWVDR